MNKSIPVFKSSCVILVLICLALICYANSFSVPFLWDDEVLILRNQYIKSAGFLREIFTTTHFKGGGEGGNFYRPLQISSYLIDYALWKFNPFGYHLTNLIFHWLTAIAAYFLIAKTTKDKLVGFLAAGFFIIHPVHTEAVTYIAGRADLLAASFLLFAFLCFLKTQEESSYKAYIFGAMSCFFYICALLSKESAMIFIPLLCLYGLSFLKKQDFKRWITWYVLFFLISAGYIILRMSILPFGVNRSLSLVAQAPLALRLITIPEIYLTYLGLLILPISLHMERHFITTSVSSIYFWLGIMLLLITIYLLKLLFRRNRTMFFYLGFFVITLIPVLNILPLNATVAEHWLYLPSLGFWTVLALAMVKLFKSTTKKKTIVVIGCFFLIFYCTRSVMRNFQWQSPIGLYAHDLKYSPKSFLLHNNLGVELFRRGKNDLAAKAFSEAVKIRPGYATSRNNLAVILETQGKIKQAKLEYQNAIKLNNYILAYGNLGRLYVQANQLQKAQELLEKGQSLYPLDAEINYYLGLTYFNQGKADQANERFQKVLRLSPHYRDVDQYLRQLAF